MSWLGLQRLRTFIIAEYHQRIHSETGMPPQARWDEGGFLPHLAESQEQLDLLLLTVAMSRLVHRDGIHFQSLRYLDLTLAAYVGESDTPRSTQPVRRMRFSWSASDQKSRIASCSSTSLTISSPGRWVTALQQPALRPVLRQALHPLLDAPNRFSDR